MRKLFLIMSVLALTAIAGTFYLKRSSALDISFRTAPVKRGDVTVTIGATGTVEPEEVIDVGAQVAGRIETFGKDANGKTIDYGAEVREGMVLAHIDESLYAADAAQVAAQLEEARANVIRAQADLLQMKAKLLQAERNWKRAQELGPSKALSAIDFDAYEATYTTTKATVAVGEAAIVQAEKTVAQAEASLKRAQTNLGYCTIRSPVNGVIIDRRVNIGQTVVASLNAPSLFLIAKDLKRMQVWVAVNEADIGQIHPDQPVRFTVDAYRDQTFVGKVGKIRLNASMTQNVVNYTVEVNTENSNGKLLPYLTANVQFEVASRHDVPIVPNAALRWTPSSADLVAPDARSSYLESSSQKTTRKGGAKKRAEAEKEGSVWVQEGAFVRPVRVQIGLMDSGNTEIAGDGVKEGMEVVIGEITQKSERAVNPFTPQFPGGARRG